MPEPHVLLVFCTSSLLLLVLPGPAVVYVVSQVARHGLVRGLIGALGVECGTLVHAGAATIGLSVLLTRSDLAFALVKYAGVGYLVLLGWRQLRSRDRHGTEGHHSEPATQPGWTAFRQGLVVEVLNPKTALFFIAFLPQFVVRGGGHETLQLGLLGGAFVAMALVVDGAYAVLTATVVGRRGHRGGRRLDRAGGLVLWGLAALAASA